MGYSYYLLPDGREAGYGVDAECDHPDCHAEIDRGLGYLCGSDPDGWRDESAPGCGRYFCGDHGGDHNCPNPDGRPACTSCDEPTDAEFHRESGGLCGYCLADDGFMSSVSYPKSDATETRRDVFRRLGDMSDQHYDETSPRITNPTPEYDGIGPWRCTECDHDHQGDRLGFICIGCPCPFVPAVTYPQATEGDETP